VEKLNMKTACPKCRSVYSVNQALLAPADSAAPAPRQARCPKCQHVFALVRPVQVPATLRPRTLDDQVLQWFEEEADSNSEMVQAALAASLALKSRDQRAIPAAAAAS
jgi:predicted Zn finger-like uncharacterized protein